MSTLIARIHNNVFNAVHQHLHTWFPGLFARFVFAGVLLVYYLHSAKTKVGDGLAGFFQIDDAAYFQIIPTVVEQFDYDASQIPLVPYKLIVYAGSYAEFILPILIVIGLFTRLAAIGMLVFVVVQSTVDVIGHHVDAETLGSWFDRFSDAAILDQRAMWSVLLVYLIIYGAGKVSIDYWLSPKEDKTTNSA